MDLVEFLTARLNEDEGVARGDEHPEYSIPYLYRIDFGEICIGTNRVLAEVDAKRRIVELGGRTDEDAVEGDGGPYDIVDWRYGIHAQAHRTVLRLLALPYAEHPDYDERWRP